jgi:hypothetical protein
MANPDRVWAKLERLQTQVSDINSRLVNLEAWVGRAFFLPVGSRWVLELFPDEISQWREAIRRIPREPLTPKERSFLESLDYYLVSERKLTIPQLSWLSAIIRRVGDRLPEIPLLRQGVGSSTHSTEYRCLSCGYKFSKPQETCSLCYGKVEVKK